MALFAAFHLIAVLLKGTSHSHGLLAWQQAAAGSLAAVLACQLQMAALLRTCVPFQDSEHKIPLT